MDLKMLFKVLYDHYNALKGSFRTVTASIFLFMMDRRVMAIMYAIGSLC